MQSTANDIYSRGGGNLFGFANIYCYFWILPFEWETDKLDMALSFSFCFSSLGDFLRHRVIAVLSQALIKNYFAIIWHT